MSAASLTLSESTLVYLHALLPGAKVADTLKLLASARKSNQDVPKLELADANTLLAGLVLKGVLRTKGRRYYINYANETRILTQAYAKAPQVCALLAKTILTSDAKVNYSISTHELGYRSWSQSIVQLGARKAAALARRLLLLILADNFSVYDQQSADLVLGLPVPTSGTQQLVDDSNRLFINFDADFFAHLHPSFAELAISASLQRIVPLAEDFDEELGHFLSTHQPHLNHSFERSLVSAALCERIGEIDFTPFSANCTAGAAAVASLVSGNREAAQAQFAAYKPKGVQTDFAQLVGQLLDLATGKAILGTALGSKQDQLKSATPDIVNGYLVYYFARTGEINVAQQILQQTLVAASPTSLLTFVVIGWAAYWTEIRLKPHQVQRLEQATQEAAKHKLSYIEGELSATLVEHVDEPKQAAAYAARAAKLSKKHGFHYLINLLPKYDPTTQTLALLSRLASQKPEQKIEQAFDKRIIWLVDLESETIEIKRQKRSKNKAGWTPGSRFSFYEAFERSTQQQLPEADGRALLQLKAAVATHGDSPRYSYYGNYSGLEAIELPEVLYCLIGHPNVVLTKGRKVCEVSLGTPTLTAIDTPQGVDLSFVPAHAEGEFAYSQVAPQQLVVYKLTSEEQELARIIGKKTVIPTAQKAALAETMPGLRERISVRSTLNLKDTNLPTVDGLPNLVMQLYPAESGYLVELKVQPLPQVNYYVDPGMGLAKDIVTTDPESDEPQRIILVRDLSAESAFAKTCLDQLPSLHLEAEVEIVGDEEETVGYQWSVLKATQALKLLYELRELQHTEGFSVEYPKGQRLKLVGEARQDQLQLSVSAQRDWFGVSGNLRLDEDRVLDFQQLLRHARTGNSNFVQVDEGEFVALTDELRQHLDKLDALLHDRDKGLRLPTLATEVFAKAVEGLEDVAYDEAWSRQVERLSKAKALEPKLPANFNAEFRDYQETGVHWLQRLAEWGVGGCLADDMGLGKTIQALALLTARAELGVGLVLAPASVTRNWLSETRKFAPALRPVLLASRSEVPKLEELAAGDLLIVSYGLLPYVGEALAALHYSSLVLDESQAIKNPAAQRTKLVNTLEADFKLATTGTPIENNLTELWSLFRFLNPGLLGSLKQFGEKYARPLARPGASEVLRDQLRRLVQPFILRRRKDDVLKELPAKTEIVLDVERGAKERALYEAIRREAVEALANSTGPQQRFKVLQQLTRLRQAACHPRLVRPASKLPSAKLELVGETITELLEGGHKALVFSQFVKHLKLVEAWVKQQGIRYHYLDGSTPGGKRQKLVNSFQAGEADLFLISLKAGGTGLNLTAADYVLHLDPWWNPAVEDQASDRAHRMGQQKPVTVYRFVSSGTIEEKIIALHAEKRDLADQLLAGTDGTGSLSVEQMVEMISG